MYISDAYKHPIVYTFVRVSNISWCQKKNIKTSKRIDNMEAKHRTNKDCHRSSKLGICTGSGWDS